MSSAAKKSTAITTAAVRPQRHGGALRNGGTNRGGSGRPASAIRERLRGSFAERIPVLEAFADGAAPITEKCPKCGHEPDSDGSVEAITTTDRLRAMDLLAKYSLGEKTELTLVSPEITTRLERQVEIINSRVHWTPSELLDALDPVWS